MLLFVKFFRVGVVGWVILPFVSSTILPSFDDIAIKWIWSAVSFLIYFGMIYLAAKLFHKEVLDL